MESKSLETGSGDPVRALPGILEKLAGLAQRSGPLDGTRTGTFGLIFILALGYFLLGHLAFLMVISEGSATSVAFLPEGMALAFTILFGPRVVPGIFIGQLFLTISLGNPLAVGAAFGLVNMLEGWAGGWLFWRWRISPAFERPCDIARLLALCGLILQPAGALARLLSQMMIVGSDGLFRLSFYAWAGNTMGQILLVPLLLSCCCAAFRFDSRELWRGLVILLVYFTGVLVSLSLNLDEGHPLYWIAVFGLFYLVLIWNAVNSSPLVTALSNFLTTMGFLWAIVVTPDFSTQDRVLYADVLIFGGVATSLIIAALFRQLHEKTGQLIQANQAKERLLAIVGHDLRSPIASFRSALDLVKVGGMGQKDFLSVQEHLRSVTDHTRWTLENIMEWAALQLDELTFTPAPWRVQPVARDAYELLRVSAEAKGIEVEIEIPDEVVVRADRQQLASILRNLLSNAVKFTGSGGRVSVRAVRLGEHWQFSVLDTGVGMTLGNVTRLLGGKGSFSSTVGTARERGAGLGLRITSSFVQAHGGSLSIESAPGRGSVFSFTLPAAVLGEE